MNHQPVYVTTNNDNGLISNSLTDPSLNNDSSRNIGNDTNTSNNGNNINNHGSINHLSSSENHFNGNSSSNGVNSSNTNTHTNNYFYQQLNVTPALNSINMHDYRMINSINQSVNSGSQQQDSAINGNNNDNNDNDNNDNNNNDNSNNNKGNINGNVHITGKVNDEKIPDSPSSGKLPRATLEQKIEVLDWHAQSEKKCQQTTVKYFTKMNRFAITKSTMNRWVLGEYKLRADFKNLTLNNKGNYKTRPRFKYPEINKCLEFYYQQICNENSLITEPELIKKWVDFYNYFYPEDMNNKVNKSNGWLHHFKKTNSIKKELAKNFYSLFQLNNSLTNKSTHNNPLLMNNIEADRERIQRELSNYNPHEIYHLDEVAISLQSCLFNNIQGNTLMSNLKNKITITLLTNATGSNFESPLILTTNSAFESHNGPTNESNNGEENDIYYSKTGLLTSEVIFKYLKKIDSNVLLNNQEGIVILLDPLYSHFIPLDEFSKIRLVYFSPLLTHQLYYPLDFGVKKLFKILLKYKIFNYFSANNSLQISSFEVIKFILKTTKVIQSNYANFISLAFQSSNLLPNRPQSNNDIKLLNRSVETELENYKASEIIKFIKSLSSKNQLSFEFKQHMSSGEDLLDQIIFPYDEIVDNLHFSDLDIIDYVKSEMNLIPNDQHHQLNRHNPQEQHQQYQQITTKHQMHPSETDHQRSPIQMHGSTGSLIPIDELLKHQTALDNSTTNQSLTQNNPSNVIAITTPSNNTNEPVNSNGSVNGNGNGIVDVAIAAALAFNQDINKHHTNAGGVINRAPVMHTHMHSSADTDQSGAAVNNHTGNGSNGDGHLMKKRKVTSTGFIGI